MTSPHGRPTDVEAWLRSDPTADELRSAYPQLWTEVQREIAEVLASGDIDELVALSTRTAQPARSTRRRARSYSDHQTIVEQHIRRLLAAETLRQVRTALATGVTEGTVRFNRRDGRRTQRLLFERGLTRKPVSMSEFEKAWPRIGQRRLLIPLVQPKGIYCFYSRELIAALADIVGGRPCLEIAAGDGTLSRFLTDHGTAVTATDDHSWTNIDFPEAVVKQDASSSLRVHQPEVVICSWPPAGNRFERDVFLTRSVDTYVLISTQVEASAGDWNAYRRQRKFTMTERPDLSALVVPPEIHPAVYVFERNR